MITKGEKSPDICQLACSMSCNPAMTQNIWPLLLYHWHRHNQQQHFKFICCIVLIKSTFLPSASLSSSQLCQMIIITITITMTTITITMITMITIAELPLTQFFSLTSSKSLADCTHSLPSGFIIIMISIRIHHDQESFETLNHHHDQDLSPRSPSSLTGSKLKSREG